MIRRTHLLENWTNRIIWMINAAMNKGNKQYPKIATDCKNDICPPKTRILNETTMPPMKTEKNSKMNWVESVVNESKCTVNKEAKNQTHEKRPPHVPVSESVGAVVRASGDEDEGELIPHSGDLA